MLLTHLKEHQLHCDVRPGDCVFYFTTCGWMMWNWLTSVLASKASIVLYDGNPAHPGPEVLYDLADRYGVTLFGTSAKFLDAGRKAGVRPIEHHRLARVRSITSTGSPLAAESFEYVYADVKHDVHLASMSGGTDLCGCFVAGDPTRPVWAGEIQGPALGMAVDVFDESGAPLPTGQGELVCTRPFPSQPLGFWGDDGSRYHAAYYERFPGVWAHGDFAMWTEHGGMIILGRSDATLNAAGVRIGTAEIYRVVERFDEVQEAIAVGQEWDGDTRIVLFVRMAPGPPARRRPARPHPPAAAGRLLSPARARRDRGRRRHPPDAQRQAHRAGRGRRRERPRGPQSRGAGQPRGPRAVPGAGRPASLRLARAQ